MPPNKDYPALRWDPETGASEKFDREEDVPEGWLDHHPSDTEKGGGAQAAPEERQPSGGKRRPNKPKPVDVPASDEEPMTRDEIVAALKEGKVTFNKDASDDDLKAQLVAALRGVLDKRGVTYDKDAGPRALLAAVRG